MSANEPPSEASKSLTRHQNRGFLHALGAAWKVPTYWPCGVRCIGGMTLIGAFVWNVRTGSVMPRERYKWKPHEADSTNAPTRCASPIFRSRENHVADDHVAVHRTVRL